jgi:hypothetical protein
MLRRLLILDAGLLILIAFGAVRVRGDWQAFGPAHQVSAIKPAPEPTATLPTPVPRPVVNEDWTDIAVKNPFSFDRNDVDVLAPVATAPVTPVGPKPVLFGTMFLDNKWLAMIGPGASGNRAFRPMKVGESIDGWNIVSIEQKNAVVESAGMRQTLIMNDPTANIPRVSDTTPRLGVPAVTNTNSTGQSSQQAPPATNAPASEPQVAPGQCPKNTKPRMATTPFGTRLFCDPL